MVAKVGLLGVNPYTEFRGSQNLEKRRLSTNPTIPTMTTLPLAVSSDMPGGGTAAGPPPRPGGVPTAQISLRRGR